MALYRCTVLNSLGEKQILIREAGDVISLSAELKKDNYCPVKLTIIKEKKTSPIRSSRMLSDIPIK